MSVSKVYLKQGQEVQAFMTNVIHQLVSSYVLMAEQTDSMLCNSLGKRKRSVSVFRVSAACYFVDQCSSCPRPYAEIWTPCVPTWRSTIEAEA